MSEILRQAAPSDFDKIYLMGFDVWAEAGQSEAQYLEMCRLSPEYKRGTWYILEGDARLVSSLIVYKLSPLNFGIGSIATPKTLRKNGYASSLIFKVIAKLDGEHTNSKIFLYSDINPEFYEKFGFQPLPSELQRYKTTICMARGNDVLASVTDVSKVPEYF